MECFVHTEIGHKMDSFSISLGQSKIKNFGKAFRSPEMMNILVCVLISFVLLDYYLPTVSVITALATGCCCIVDKSLVLLMYILRPQ